MRNAAFLGEGIFTMGLVKTIYNVLGGFYVLYNSIILKESVHKLHKNMKMFLYVFNRKFPVKSKSNRKNEQLYGDIYKIHYFQEITRPSFSVSNNKKYERGGLFICKNNRQLISQSSVAGMKMVIQKLYAHCS